MTIEQMKKYAPELLIEQGPGHIVVRKEKGGQPFCIMQSDDEAMMKDALEAARKALA